MYICERCAIFSRQRPLTHLDLPRKSNGNQNAPQCGVTCWICLFMKGVFAQLTWRRVCTANMQDCLRCKFEQYLHKKHFLDYSLRDTEDNTAKSTICVALCPDEKLCQKYAEVHPNLSERCNDILYDFKLPENQCLTRPLHPYLMLVDTEWSCQQTWIFLLACNSMPTMLCSLLHLFSA